MRGMGQTRDMGHGARDKHEIDMTRDKWDLGQTWRTEQTRDRQGTLDTSHKIRSVGYGKQRHETATGHGTIGGRHGTHGVWAWGMRHGAWGMGK